jgi:hypothetical protein
MKKNQKGFSIIEVVLVILAVFVFLVVLGMVAGKNQGKTTKSTTAAKTPALKPALFTTSVWAGYLKYSNDINKPMTSVSAEWNVPGATLADNIQLSSDWIGIGGYEGQAPKGLIQIGTDSDTGLIDNGTRVNHYSAFWECFPTAAEHIPSLNVNAGDSMQSSIVKQGTDWAMTLTDKTTGQNFQKTVACSPEPHTAEWILENVGPPGQPAGTQGVLPKLTTTTFSNLTANGKAPGLANQIKFNMTSDGTPKGTVVVAPSDLTGNGSTFTLTDNR